MNAQLKAIRERLATKQDATTIAFLKKIVPGSQKVYGVKTPELNLLAKEFKAGGFELVKALWDSGALEEKIIAIKILEKIGSKDPGRSLRMVKQFAATIDNWAVCDGLGMQALRAARKTHPNEIFAVAKQYNLSKDPWQRRLSLVMVEWYTRDPSLHPQINKLVKAVENDKEYYVRKAVQWIRRNLKKGK